MRLSQPFEHVAVQEQGLDRVEGEDACVAWSGCDHGQLAEHVTRAEDEQGGHVTERGGALDGNVTLVDEVESVTGIPLVEDDLASLEPTPAGLTEKHSTLLSRYDVEHWHCTADSLPRTASKAGWIRSALTPECALAHDL